MLGPWWRELQKLSLPSEIFVSQCKNMSVLRWLPCSLMQKVTVRRPFSMEPKLSSLFYSGNVQDRELEQIHSRYMNCLRTFIEYNYPQEPNRVQELLVKLPEVISACKMAKLSKINYWFKGSRSRWTTLGIQDVLRSLPTELRYQHQQNGGLTCGSIERFHSTPKIIQPFSHFSKFAIIVTILPIYSNSYSSPVTSLNRKSRKWTCELWLVLYVFWIITRVTMSNFLCMIHWYFLEILFNLVHWCSSFSFLFYQRC